MLNLIYFQYSVYFGQYTYTYTYTYKYTKPQILNI